MGDLVGFTPDQLMTTMVSSHLDPSDQDTNGVLTNFHWRRSSSDLNHQLPHQHRRKEATAVSRASGRHQHAKDQE